MPHPLNDKKVMVVSTNGFIHVGTLKEIDGYRFLIEAVNIRYWSKRSGGLPEVAKNGFVGEDRIDKCHKPIWLESVVFITESV